MNPTMRGAVRAVLAVPTISLLNLVPAAHAQEGTAAMSVEEVIVTSSRIPQLETAVSAPIIEMDANEIRLSGKSNLTELLRELPALTGSLDSNDASGPNAFIGGTGLTLLNLRNLGVDRTLVLVNGRRHVAANPGSAAVDVETIPFALIDRVEVQTGGASAIYGADGVSGVVNFMLRERFEGVDSRVQFGRSSRGDGDSRLASFVFGQNFWDSRGNATLALEYASEDRVNQNQRHFTRTAGRARFVGNPNDRGDIPGVPDQIPVTDLAYWDSSPSGAVYLLMRNGSGGLSLRDNLIDFNGYGQAYDYGTVPPTSGAPFPTLYQQGGDGTRVASNVGDLLPEKDRYTINLFSDLDLTDSTRVFTEIKYSRSEASALAQPTYDFTMIIQPENPFIPAPIVAAAGGLPVAMSRDHFDLGIRHEGVTRETLRGVVGIDGDLGDNLRFETSYVYGETQATVNRLNRYQDRFSAAIDVVTDPATGQPVCRSTLTGTATNARTFTPGPASGCVPINLFGENAISTAGAAWIMTDSVNRSTIAQHVAQAYLSGTSEGVFTLPAGPIGFAVGAEWRKETSKSTPAIENQLGLVFGNVLLPERGEYSVREAFTEVNVPLLRDLPLVERLTIDGAFRYSDYSTTGDATTWKTGVSWSPTRAVTLRGTIAEATRAPNIGELYDPGAQTFRVISDPCDTRRLSEGSSTRAANCTALLGGLGVNTSVPYQDLNTSSVRGTLVGNRHLTEEVAKTKTLGLVLRPSIAPSLTLALDWYDIELTDAISTATPLEAAQLCVDSPTIDNEFCGLITRTAGTGRITSFVQQPQNVARFTTEGYDLTVGYGLETASIGNFGVRVVSNKLEELTFISLPGAEPDIDLGEEDAPEWQVNFDLTWQLGVVTLNYGFNYFDKTLRVTHAQLAGNPDIVEPRYVYLDSKFTHDLQARLDLKSGLSLYGGINNFMDQTPDIGRDAYPVSPMGRYVYAGMAYRGL